MYMMLLTWFYYGISIVSVGIRVLNKIFFSAIKDDEGC